MGGTFDMLSARLIRTSTPGPSGSGWKVGVGERGGCTLLGPEGPDAGAFRGRGVVGPSGPCLLPAVCWWWGRIPPVL